MEHGNFDNDFRKKLESRKIVPSNEAWNTLVMQLNTQNKPRKNTAILYWIAASVTILLISSTYFLTINNDKTTIPVVENNKTPGEIISKEQEPVIKKIMPLVQENTEKEKPAAKKAAKPFTREALAVHQQTQDTKSKEKLPGSQKIDETTAGVQKLQREAGVTTTEIDALLAQAQKEITSERKLTDTIRKIDAMALLEGVEEELDQSFKERVFETLKESFYKVTTAVAERNN